MKYKITKWDKQKSAVRIERINESSLDDYKKFPDSLWCDLWVSDSIISIESLLPPETEDDFDLIYLNRIVEINFFQHYLSIAHGVRFID